MRISAITILIFTALCGFSQQKPHRYGTVALEINLQGSGQTLVLGEKQYHSNNGDSLYLDLLRFYLSAFQLQGSGIRYAEKGSYHLIDADVPETKTIVLERVPVGRYQSLEFCVGTDSLANVSGALGGDLDPTKGMYWGWNGGYINFKMEGRSSSCKTRYNGFEFHVGGYMPPYETLRRLQMPLKHVRVRENATTQLRINVDVVKFFDNIELEKTNQVMQPSAAAKQLSGYFQGVFSVE